MMTFRWQGEIIDDVRQWAAERKMELMLVRITRPSRPNPFTGLMSQPEIEDVEMPRIFYDSFLCRDGEHIKALMTISENLR